MTTISLVPIFNLRKSDGNCHQRKKTIALFYTFLTKKQDLCQILINILRVLIQKALPQRMQQGL